MGKNNVTDRLTFLAEVFDVFQCDLENSELDEKLKQITSYSYEPFVINGHSGNVLAIVSSKLNEKNRLQKKISICSSVFTEMIIADPTDNKVFLQWMLNIFSKLAKEGTATSIESAIRFVEEDLPQANKYLTLFEENKRKKKFKDLCNSSYVLRGITDSTDINQYKSLSQLFDAVDPFIEKDTTTMERNMQRFVDAGQALIPVKDRKFTLFIPLTLEASVIFEDFASWCTARAGNGMFKSYKNHKKPNGKESDIYIIVNNLFFEGKSNELYQLHFETNQLKDRQNGSNVSIFESVISKSEGITNFFYEELIKMAKSNNRGLDNNIYLDYLIKFGFTDSLFELIEETTPTIRFMTREIPKLPNISKFKSLDQLIITNAKLSEIHPSIGELHNLEMLVLTSNKIKALPKEIGNLKNLQFLNLIDNPIIDIPDEITYLDKSNGGSLHRLGVKEEHIGHENYQKLKTLLPTTLIS